MTIQLFPTWDADKAKSNFLDLLTEAQQQEQIILQDGEPCAVVIGYDIYKERGEMASARDFFKTISVEETVEPPERSEQMRDVEL